MVRKILSIEEVMAILEDEDEDVDAVYVVPPDKIDELTDEEYIDEDAIPMNDNVGGSNLNVFTICNTDFF